MDEPLVRYDGTGTTSRRWLIADERGSIVAETNASGAAVQVNTYGAWDEPGNANTGRFGYTGQVFLGEVGLYHYKARAYNPEIGRFLQTDPIGVAGGMNLYAYVGGDPVNNTDSMGLACDDADTCPIKVVGQSLGWRFKQYNLHLELFGVNLRFDVVRSLQGEQAGRTGNAPCEPPSDDPNSYNGAVNETARNVIEHQSRGDAVNARQAGDPTAFGVVRQRHGFLGGGYYAGGGRTFGGNYSSRSASVTGSNELPLFPDFRSVGGSDVAIIFGQLNLAAVFGDYTGDYEAGLRQWLDKVQSSRYTGGFDIPNVYIIDEEGHCEKYR